MTTQKLNTNKSIRFFNSDIMLLDSRIKYENDNVDTIPLDTRVKHEYDKAEIVFENDNSVSSSCHSRAMTRESRNKDIMPLGSCIKYENDNVDTITTGCSAQGPSMTKDNNDICVSILCHSRVQT